VWSLCVVVDALLLDDDFGFPEAVEHLAIEAFIAQLAVKGLAVTIFPGLSWLDVQAPRANTRQPVAQNLGNH